MTSREPSASADVDPEASSDDGARILLVEDDPALRRAMELALQMERFVVDAVPDAETALARSQADPPDLVLTDVLLDGMNGLDLCHRIRQAGDMPIIVVSARGDSHDLVAGLEAGADDYVVKPFLFDELIARIRALLRRTGGSLIDHGHPTVSGDLMVSGDWSLVVRGDRTISLTRLETRLLRVFVEHTGQVVSRDQLIELVWSDRTGDDRVVDTHVSRLRRKLDDPDVPSLITTERGLGYRYRPA